MYCGDYYLSLVTCFNNNSNVNTLPILLLFKKYFIDLFIKITSPYISLLFWRLNYDYKGSTFVYLLSLVKLKVSLYAEV